MEDQARKTLEAVVQSDKKGQSRAGNNKVEAQPGECVERDHYSDSLPEPP